jgi:hypothetical protein
MSISYVGVHEEVGMWASTENKMWVSLLHHWGSEETSSCCS